MLAIMVLSCASTNTEHHISCEPKSLQAVLLLVLGIPILTAPITVKTSRIVDDISLS